MSMEEIGNEFAKKFQHYRQVSWEYFQAWNGQTPTVIEVYVEIGPNMPFYDIIEKKGELTIFMIAADETPDNSMIIDPQTPDPSKVNRSDVDAANKAVDDMFESFEKKEDSARTAKQDQSASDTPKDDSDITVGEHNNTNPDDLLKE